MQGAFVMIRQTLLIAAAVLMAACVSSKSQDIGGSFDSTYRSDDGFKMVDARSEVRSSDDQFKKKTKDLSGFSGYAWGASFRDTLRRFHAGRWASLMDAPIRLMIVRMFLR